MTPAEAKISPYQLPKDKYQAPPTSFRERLKFIGPGIVVTASIVGSGELIATTTLGARAGFIALWAILLSCLLKVILQLEMGRMTITTGKPTLAFWDMLPGPRLVANWAVWCWGILLCVKFIQFGGIVGGCGQSLMIPFPGLGLTTAALMVMIAVILILVFGRYDFIEKITGLFVFLFVVFTVGVAIMTLFTPWAFSLKDVLSGLTFRLPPEIAFYALGAFGITGIGGDEIVMYSYWCVEKGYSALTGPADKSPEWYDRARGWIRVMYLDAVIAMVIYTVATIAFYILGASILHGMEKIPAGMELVKTLAHMYVEPLGPWALYVVAIGGFIVLFSTLISWTAANQRIVADFLTRLKLIDLENYTHLNTVIIISGIALPIVYTLIALVWKAPAFLVFIGGWGTALILLVIIFGALYHRYRLLDKELRPSIFYDLYLIVGSLAIALVIVYTVIRLLD
ncbi:MAG: Nramp family divalent metal transporter [Deltaproteobacteria bacterium]|nr:MAG: Nramp family divalent metal transporter [Deltaproteobacteria bacterium]